MKNRLIFFCHHNRKIIIAACTYLALLIVPIVCRSQEPELHFSHISSSQGLSNSTIESILQDSRGFIWVGTRDGLNRYDGANMLVFRNNRQDSNSLSDDFITSMYEDEQQSIWIGTRNGLNIFNPLSNRFTRLANMPGATTLQDAPIATLYGNKKGHIWVSTTEGHLYTYHQGKLRQVKWKVDGKVQTLVTDLHAQVFFEDQRGILWAGTTHGLYRYHQAIQAFESWDAQPLAGQKLSIRAIAEDKLGNLLLGTAYDGLISYHPTMGVVQHFKHVPGMLQSISSNMVMAVAVNAAGEIWIGTVNGGLDKYEPLTGSFQHFYYQPENPQSLSQRTVSVLFIDKQENLWIGTHRGGLNLYAPKAKKFITMQQQASGNGLSYNDVKAFCEDSDGNIWIGTDGGGLNKYIRQNQSFIHYKYNAQQAQSIGSNEVLSIIEDSFKQLWVATWGGGLCKFDSRNNRFVRYQTKSTNSGAIGSNFVQCMVEDKPGKLYVGTYYGGLFVFDIEKEVFTPIPQQTATANGVSGHNVVSLLKDRSGHIWVGTDDGGLNKIDKATGHVEHYFHEWKKKPDIRVLFADSKGNIWVGHQGLYKYDATAKQFRLFSTAEGLATLFIKGIVEDNHGQFWISTSNGLKKLDPETKTVRTYNTNDGLQNNEFEANAAFITKDGEIYLGGINGCNRFYPHKIAENNYVPPVFVTQLWVHNNAVIGGKSPLLPQDISYSQALHLPYNLATFSLGFAALNYTIAENNQFLYKLDKWDKDWIQAGKEQKATYTNLPPGTYEFIVKAANNDGVWNTIGYSITIYISPPFWATWWFRLLMGILLCSGAYYLFLIRKRVLHQWHEKEKKEAIHQMQLDFFTNISHEFRTPLSLITGPIDSLMKQQTDEKTKHTYQVIQRNAHRLLLLINELIDFRKAKSGALKLQVMPGNMHLFVHELAEEFSELANQKKIDFTVLTPATQLPEYWFDRQVLEKIIINLLSNAFKYTPENGQVTLEVRNTIDGLKPQFEPSLVIVEQPKTTDFVFIRIADSGAGISKTFMPHLFERFYRVSDAHVGSGIGLAFVKALTQLHKGNIYVYSEYGKGTEIIVGIPAAKACYQAAEMWMKTTAVHSETASSKLLMANAVLPATSATPSAAVPNVSSKKYTVLIADDNADLLSFLTDSLSPFYNIVAAADGQEALQKTLQSPPDLIISDIMMPVMDGIAFCQQVKSTPATAAIPFILLTAKNAPETRQEGTVTGADYFFTKPVSTDLLLATLNNIFTQRALLQQAFRNDQLADVKAMAQTSQDKAFLDELLAVIESHLSNTEMDIDFVCLKMGMSRTKLYSKMKSITGQPIGDFIRSIRLRKAAEMMMHGEQSLTEIMYSVGIQTQSYFSKAFKQEFGKTPTQFLRDIESISKK